MSREEGRQKGPKPLQPKARSPKMWEGAPLSRKAESIRHEQRLSHEMGFRLQPGSGSLKQVWWKEDGVDGDFLYQVKQTAAETAGIVSLGVLQELVDHAIGVRKRPVVVVTFKTAKRPVESDWVMIPLSLWMELTHGEQVE